MNCACGLVLDPLLYFDPLSSDPPFAIPGFSVMGYTLISEGKMITFGVEMTRNSHSRAVNFHSFPFPSLSFIPIPMGFTLDYSYSPPIPKHVLQNNKV